MAVVDQREVQRRGGVCAKVPVSCVVADVLGAAGLRVETLRVVDATYGEGRFWAAARPRVLVGIDVRRLGWVVEPDVFIEKPVWAARRLLAVLRLHADLVAVDPPWGGATRKRSHYAITVNPAVILAEAEKLARQLGARYMLVHYRERWVPHGWRLLAEQWWRPVSRYINAHETWFGVAAVEEQG